MAQIAEIEEQMAQTVQGQSIVEGKLIPIIYGENPEQAQQDQEIMRTTADHWYSEFSEFLGKDIFPPRTSHIRREAFVEDLKNFAWEDPFLYHRCTDGMFRRCAMEFQFQRILEHCHLLQADGHHGAVRTASRVLQSGFYWPTLEEDAHNFVSNCEACQGTGNLVMRPMKPLNWVNEIDAYDVWEVSLMGPLLHSDKREFILVAVDYASQWAEIIALGDREFFRIERFILKHLVCRLLLEKKKISDDSLEYFSAELDAIMERPGSRHQKY